MIQNGQEVWRKAILVLEVQNGDLVESKGAMVSN
jgi:hypothetical protein